MKNAIKILIKPIIRPLIKLGVSEQALSQIVREAFVEVVYENFAIPDKPVSVARVAVLTALSRKEVIKLNRLKEDSHSSDPTYDNLAYRAIRGWLTDPVFLTTKKTPRILLRLVDGLSFPTLVA